MMLTNIKKQCPNAFWLFEAWMKEEARFEENYSNIFSRHKLFFDFFSAKGLYIKIQYHNEKYDAKVLNCEFKEIEHLFHYKNREGAEKEIFKSMFYYLEYLVQQLINGTDY